MEQRKRGRPKKDPQDLYVKFSLNLHPNLLSELDKVAIEENEAKAVVARRAIRTYLNSRKDW